MTTRLATETPRTAPRGNSVGPLRRAAESFGGAVAVISGGRCITYAELLRRVGALASALRALQVPEGGRIDYLDANSLVDVECAMGVPGSGQVLVDLYFRLAEAELAFIVDVAFLGAAQVDRHANLNSTVIGP